MEKLKNYALLAAVCIITFLTVFVTLQRGEMRKAQAEAARLESNQTALCSELARETNRAGNLQATVRALTLERDELAALMPEYEAKLKDMGIRLKEAQHVAKVQTELAAAVSANRDTVYNTKVVEVQAPAAGRYVYRDDWITAVIVLKGDEVAELGLEARDSLTLVLHKERRRCLFKKQGIRYTVESASPYTTVTGMQFVEIFD